MYKVFRDVEKFFSRDAYFDQTCHRYVSESNFLLSPAQGLLPVCWPKEMEANRV